MCSREGQGRRPMRHSDQRGIALITTLLVTMLMSALLVGFTAVIISDQRYRFIDRDRVQAFYGASGALEKLTADLGNLFFTNLAPTAAQVAALTSAPPSIPEVAYSTVSVPNPLPASSLSTYYCSPSSVPPKHTVTSGTSGYTIMFCADATGNPVTTTSSAVKTGPYEGLIAATTPYQLDVTAHTSSGGEVHLIRTMEAVAIPVFQFGMFSDVDLAFFAGPNFGFGGRVHTNGHLFLAEGTGSTLTLSDKVTAVKEVVRQRLQNGVTINNAHTGIVKMAKAPGLFRNLAATEGSVTDGPTSPQNEPTWHTISLSTYNSYIRNSRTGAKALNLPLITVGGSNPDLIRRPATGEDTTNPILFNERLFSKASLRILLSDTAAEIMTLPTVTAVAPIQLDGNWNITVPDNGTPYGPIDASHPPVARTPGPSPLTVNGQHNAGWTVLNVNGALPAYFRIPTLTVTPAAGAPQVVVCAGRTPTSFTGCTQPTAPVAAGATVSAAPNSVNSTTPSTVTTANWTLGAPTITVASTAAFSAAWFYVTTSAGAQILVTCTGYDTAMASKFTGCGTNNGAATPQVSTNATVVTNALSQAQTGTIGGFIKIDMQDATGAWNDVTMQILNYGIGGRNLDGTVCADPAPNAILRIQRLRDNGGVRGVNNDGGGCSYAGSTNAADYWPNVVFDPREGLQRDVAPAGTSVILGGVMHYIAIDAANLAKWFTGAAPFGAGTGANAKKDNGGFTVYFSDRRNNKNASGAETGEYGWEDFVNPLSGTGAPNGTLDAGEDVNSSGLLDTYGGVPNYNGTVNTAPPGATAPLTAAATPLTSLKRGEAQVNRSILFRHALKLVNGATLGALGIGGLTVVSENPVYVQGNWNASGAFNNPHAATAVLADAVTLLSNEWNDSRSFSSPYSPGGRPRTTQSWYRLAIVSGKGIAFSQPAGTANDFGTDGGTHNFLRFIESGAAMANYRGSIATFYYNRQAVGTYKCCTTVYSPPTRNFVFDVDFYSPALLPPNTPVFRDMNAVGFSQDLRPGR